MLEQEQFSENIWECACGGLHLSKVLTQRGYTVRNSDIVNRTNDVTVETLDFLSYSGTFDGDIITNPPYKYAKEFVKKSLEVIPTGHKVAMFLKLTFLESRSRRELFDKTPPKTVYVSFARLQCAKNGEFEKYINGAGTAVAYGWYVWVKGFCGNPIIKWIN